MFIFKLVQLHAAWKSVEMILMYHYILWINLFQNSGKCETKALESLFEHL